MKQIVDRVIEVWTKERSVIKLRQMYEAACLDDDRNIEHSADSKRPSIAYENGALDSVVFHSLYVSSLLSFTYQTIIFLN